MVRGGSSRIRACLWYDADFRVLETASKGELVCSDVERLVVDAQGGVIRPIVRGGGPVQHRVEFVVAPRADRIGGLRYREQVQRGLGVLLNRDGYQNPATRVLIIERLGIEDRHAGDDVGKPRGQGSLRHRD